MEFASVNDEIFLIRDSSSEICPGYNITRGVKAFFSIINLEPIIMDDETRSRYEALYDEEIDNNEENNSLSQNPEMSNTMNNSNINNDVNSSSNNMNNLSKQVTPIDSTSENNRNNDKMNKNENESLLPTLVIATNDFISHEYYQLDIKKDELLIVTNWNCKNEGWVYGYRKDNKEEKGMFPKCLVKKYNDENIG